MNILYLHTHDTGRYIAPYGVAADTPHLMTLAREGTLFRNAHCAGPTCSPSRAALLTGEYPHQNGMWGLAHRGFSLARPQRHLAAFLARSGYRTALCGIQHESEDAGSLGYDLILGDTDYAMSHCDRDWAPFDMGNAAAAAAFVREEHDRPFFLSFGLFSTHRVYPKLPHGAETDYVQVPPGICDTPQNRADTAAFLDSARIADAAVGVVLHALHESGRGSDTAVVFTTDHGLALPGMKCTLTDRGTGVALMLRYPGNPMAGRAVDALVSHIDLYPTLCALAGLNPPDWLQGVSLLPLLRGECDTVRDAVFSEVNYHVAYEPQRAVRTARFKYIRRFGAYDKPIGCNSDDCPDKTARIEAGYYTHARPDELLYDLISDPLEGDNLAGHPDYADIRAALAARLAAWMAETDDPLRRGVMPPPAGAKVNPPTSLTPGDKTFIQDFSQIS